MTQRVIIDSLWHIADCLLIKRMTQRMCSAICASQKHACVSHRVTKWPNTHIASQEPFHYNALPAGWKSFSLVMKRKRQLAASASCRKSTDMRWIICSCWRALSSPFPKADCSICSVQDYSIIEVVDDGSVGVYHRAQWPVKCVAAGVCAAVSQTLRADDQNQFFWNHVHIIGYIWSCFLTVLITGSSDRILLIQTRWSRQESCRDKRKIWSGDPDNDPDSVVRNMTD